MIIRPADIMRAGSVEEVHAAFRDYDAELADSARKAGNVFWGATFILDDSGEREDKQQPTETGASAVAWESLGHVVGKGLPVRAEKAEIGATLRAQSPQAIPIPKLVEAGRGIGFAQIRHGADGVVRKYPTLISCDYKSEDSGQTYLFPSIGLAMACEYLQVPLKNLKLRPGEYLELPGAFMPDGSTKDLRIPINEKGEMIINWVGNYTDTFKHFPYSSLTLLAENQALIELKGFIADRGISTFEDPGQLISATQEAFPEARSSTIYNAYLLY